ncbi:SAM-dependent methyltransferase [Crossiella sp. SN42]|uniref:cobalt-precorrin-4/precorrin-4 C(11)-methyltransferase n=1 Tax=Crossiella sp. SN42 TaxID=2944808 RepID=UPI00207CF902|nr:cobalt-precorrin-4/precorrin-4 C(11)-methyltransferase [Crossiella sp. SN42]MCO1576589.1 SAM-dependent methyltransferase [Crossiella sp. SN42]
MSGRISFIGAGPGAADLITLRGARRIAEADIVVWSPAVVDADCVREHAGPDAELVDCSRVNHEQVLEVYRRAAVKKQSVVRLHSGDAALWGAVQDQYDAAQKIGLEVEIIPGVSALAAAAAGAGRELSPLADSAPVVLTRPEGDTGALPDGAKLRELAAHGGTMAVALSAARTEQLVEELRAGGYAEDTPVVVAYKTSWPDELLVQTTLGDLAGTVKDHKLWRQTLFLIGQVLRPGSQRARLYQPGTRPTSYRRGDFTARRAERLAAAQPPDQVVEAEAPAATPSTRWSGRDQLESTRSSRAGARYRTGASKRAAAAAATRSGQVTLALHERKRAPQADAGTQTPAAQELPATHAADTGPRPVGAQSNDGQLAGTRPASAESASTRPTSAQSSSPQSASARPASASDASPQPTSPAPAPRVETVKVAVSVEAPHSEPQAATPAKPAVKAPAAAKSTAGKSKAKSTATRRTKRTPRNS